MQVRFLHGPSAKSACRYGAPRGAVRRRRGPLFESGHYEEGADRAQALIAGGGPCGAAVYYNTPCVESRAGRTDEAIAHLSRAVELARSMAELARDDEDFKALRENPAFAELVGA